MRVKPPRTIFLRPAPGLATQARIALRHGVRPAALGRSGIRTLKREGDGGTPLGFFPVRQVLYRADRVSRPLTRLPVRAIGLRDGWCDDPTNRNYNRLIRLPSERSAEGLSRADQLYDLVLVLGYNDRPRVRGRGSAIFVHLARPDFTPTDGCIGLTKHDLTMLLAEIGRGTKLVVMR
jgi:L,D-peptidoglycan transpeptidase YkuD (ErfK/YbiS/YcfS/YnhG family)